MTPEQNQHLRLNSEWYVSQLTDNIMPFWMEHGLDRRNGGIHTCLDRDGTLMDSTKPVWFQGRFAYTAALAYNRILKKQEWLEASRSCIDFLERHCFDTDGHMFFTVTSEGAPLRKRRYVFSECFAAMAMAEYALASNDPGYAGKALEIFNRVRFMLSEPGFLEPKGYVPVRSHSVTMLLINVALVLKQVCSDPVLAEQIDRSVSEIERYHCHPEFSCILETVNMDGTLLDTCEGRVINPGHGIETSWFLMQAFLQNRDGHILELALRIFDWQYGWGWDETYGGIINFRDCRGFPCQDYSQDMKFWWPQCECVIASLFAYELTRDERYLDIYFKADSWMRKHLVDPDHPEWFGYLHRDGSVAQTAKGNLFKGPFHIPRMMVMAHLLIDKILR